MSDCTNGCLTPVLLVVPILPAFGIFFLIQVIKLVYWNRQLSKEGISTHAQIVDKYEHGSKDVYKQDQGKLYLFVCEFVVRSHKTDKRILCRNKFMVSGQQYFQHELGDYIELLYLPLKFRQRHNLRMLNEELVKPCNVLKRITFGLLLVFGIPGIVSLLAQEWRLLVLTEKWELFLLLVSIAMLYYIVGYWVFTCFCSNRRWALKCKRTSFRAKYATAVEILRFQEKDKSNIELLVRERKERMESEESRRDDDVRSTNIDGKQSPRTDDKRVSLLLGD